MTFFEFTVHGTPAPQGSKRHVGNGVMVESSKKVKPWRQDVKYAALESLKTLHRDDWSGFNHGDPVALVITFYLPRPRSHYRTGKNQNLLRDAAPAFPTGKPDVDKLTRSTMDAISEAGLWYDDSLVVQLVAVKKYATRVFPVGAHIVIDGAM